MKAVLHTGASVAAKAGDAVCQAAAAQDRRHRSAITIGPRPSTFPYVQFPAAVRPCELPMSQNEASGVTDQPQRIASHLITGRSRQ
jgi:hypothetical protein